MRGDGPYLDLSTEQIRFRLRKTFNPNPSVNFYRRNTFPPSQIFVSRFIARKLGCYVIEAKKTSPSRRADRSRIASTNLIEIRVNLVPSKKRPSVLRVRANHHRRWHTSRMTRATPVDNLEIRAKSSQSPFPRGRNHVYAWFAINIPRENWERETSILSSSDKWIQTLKM